MISMTQALNSPVRFNGSICWWRDLKPVTKRGGQTITHRRIGNTLFTVIAECAPDATEPIGSKLERLMMRRLTNASSYPVQPDSTLAFRGNPSEYRVG